MSTMQLAIAGGLSVDVSSESHKVVRTVEAKSGTIRVSFIPVSAKEGVTSLKSLGYKGSAAKAIIRKAKREIGSAVVGAMATAVASGKLDWKSVTLSKTGTFGVFFSQGEGADAKDLAAAEERAEKAEQALLNYNQKLEATKAALLAKGCTEDEVKQMLGL